jgi:4-aminobutyrate aminotransferase
MSTMPAVRPNLPHFVTPLPGPKAQAIIQRDHAITSPSYTRGYPLVIERGEGAMVIDPDGNRFLDFNAGIAVVATGHSHPAVVKAIQEQAAKFLHYSGTDFYYENMVDLAEKLASLVPGESARRVYFGNSGTEAVEAAVKLARYHTHRDKMIAFFGSFHGRTMGSLSLTASKSVQRRGFGALLSGVHHLAYPNCYRCAYGQKVETCHVECMKAMEETLIRHIAPAEEIAAVMFEPVQGEGGYIVPPQKAVDELVRICRKHGILIIADEVQSGMGRTGKMFASEHFGLEPDLITIAKGIASGMPVSAMVARAEVMDWKPGAHASTFGGNPVAVAAAVATVELLEQELVANAANIGGYMKERMQTWPRRFPIVGDVRGLGLMLGFEIVKDQGSRERAPELRDQIELKAFDKGLLILGCGPNSIRLCPPLVIDQEQADFALTVLEEILGELS